MRIAVGVISLLGVLLFGAALSLSFARPAVVEGWAQTLLEREIRQRVVASLDAVERSAIGQFTQRLADQHPAPAAALQRQLQERVAPLVEAVVVEMRNPDCPCRRQLVAWVGTLPPGRLAELLQPGGRLTGFIQAKYAEVAGALLREFRIFSAANALMFALLGVTLLLRRRLRASLLVPATLLLATTLAVGYLYLFQQDWLHAIVFGDYIGWGYFVHLAVVAAVFADLWFHRAQRSTGVVNFFLSLIGSAGKVSC